MAEAPDHLWLQPHHRLKSMHKHRILTFSHFHPLLRYRIHPEVFQGRLLECHLLGQVLISRQDNPMVGGAPMYTSIARNMGSRGAIPCNYS